MPFLEVFGWLGALLTLAAYSMRSMFPLRCVALGANVAFITYGALTPVYPMLALHLGLLPLNAYRLAEILLGLRRMRAASRIVNPVDALRPFLRPTRFSDGDVVFRRGDVPDRIYYLERGTVLLPELGERLLEGAIFGEMAYFSDAGQRTASAICEGDCSILSIDEKSFMMLNRQHPEFGHYLIRLIAQRLVDGHRKRPELYEGFIEQPSAGAMKTAGSAT
ncbi:Crp/Fnr family transcriptional regulator [Marivita geojedonensis]|uniref:Cyclic nucleotide-binding domain-containing protein n=1 Tax=Marivita geojedonensis TaxID=1123756 RepID=A0A1X4NLW2_9RHOB|nr:cyclic nucleotide-binding domain-containing protein [Marivita geojedonensis]OSQ51343.1 hypothetical protein MGEO_07635 [Marivita geojedonensis]PRY78009.1 Cyclic nucleotide-binding domain-containing protein [Marivita geojedonensis]